MSPSPRSSSPTSDEEEALTVPMPGFRPLPPSPGPDPLDPDATTTFPTSNGDVDESDGWAEADVEVGLPGTSPTSTGSSRASIDPTALQDMTHAIVGIASMLVRWVRARRRPGMHPAVWIADEEDQAAIGDPLARIAARHAPIDGEGSADVVDAGAMLIGTAGYTLKNLPREAEPWDDELAEQLDDTGG